MECGQLLGARQNGVAECAGGVVCRRGVDPGSGVSALLAEHGDAQAVGAQFAAEDIDVHLLPLVGRIRRGIPIGDDDAAGGVGQTSGMNETVSSAARHSRLSVPMVAFAAADPPTSTPPGPITDGAWL